MLQALCTALCLQKAPFIRNILGYNKNNAYEGYYVMNIFVQIVQTPALPQYFGQVYSGEYVT